MGLERMSSAANGSQHIERIIIIMAWSGQKNFGSFVKNICHKDQVRIIFHVGTKKQENAVIEVF